MLYLFLKGADMGTAAEQLLNGTYGSYLLLAIPLFILAATFMSTGSIMDRLLRFCNAIVGRFPGGLAQVNVLQSIVFASMSGSALADAAGSGKLMQEMMTRGNKYTPEFAAALSRRVVGHRADPAAVDSAGAVRTGVRRLHRLPVHGRRDARAADRRRADGADLLPGQAPQLRGRGAGAAARACRASRARRCRP